MPTPQSPAHGRVYTTGAWVAPGHVYITEASGRVYSLGLELHLAGLVWTTEACTVTGLIYTTEACAKLWLVYTVEACTAPGAAKPQYRGLSCAWRCLDISSLCCSSWGVSDLIRKYESCASPTAWICPLPSQELATRSHSRTPGQCKKVLHNMSGVVWIALTRFRWASNREVIHGPKRGFSLVAGHRGYFFSWSEIFSFPFKKCAFSYNTVLNRFF